MVNSIFDFISYRKYLGNCLPVQGEGRGLRAKLARELNCVSAFVSQVINGRVDFSLEHAILVSRFLGHNQEERDYFLLLLQFEKAGSQVLKAHFKIKIQEVQEKRKIIAERIKVQKNIPSEEQITYYSHWYYAAIHIAIAIPDCDTVAKISRYLAIPQTTVTKCLKFLVTSGFAIEESGHYRIGSRRIHLSPGSPMVIKHHTNWRLRAIQELEKERSDDLHFSGVIALSKTDCQKVHEIFLKAIENTEQVLTKTNEEELVAISVDVFSMGAIS